MKNIQEVFDRISQIKKEQKNSKGVFKDALDNSNSYLKLSEELKTLKEKKKQAETIIQRELGAQFQKIEDLKLEMESQKEMLSDIALASVMKGETVEVKDEYGNIYEPIWSVKFKKNESKTKSFEF